MNVIDIQYIPLFRWLLYTTVTTVHKSYFGFDDDDEDEDDDDEDDDEDDKMRHKYSEIIEEKWVCW